MGSLYYELLSNVSVLMLKAEFFFAVGDRTESCTFPSWLYSPYHQYQSLNRESTYHFNEQGTSLSIFSRAQDRQKKKYKCHSVVENKPGKISKIVLALDIDW